MMSLFKFSLAVIITCCVVCIEVPAISAQARKEEESIMWETKFNSLQASQLLLQTIVLKLVSGQDKENERRIALESNLAHETEKRTLLEASQLQLKNSLSQETRKRTLLEDLFHSLQNGLSYEKQRRTELEDQVARLKAVLKDQHETLQKAVENVTLLSCVPSSHKMKALKDQYETLQKAVENVALLCCVPSSHKMKVHGNWSPWGSWGDCTRACGDGQRMRFRTCTNPNPTNGGMDCVGHSQDTDSCSSTACPSVLRHARIIIGGGHGDDVDKLNSPQDVAVSPAGGRFYVADTQNYRVNIYSDKGVFLKTFGSYGQGDGRFNFPTGLAVNSHEDIIIADRYNQRIVVYGRDGDFKYTFGKHGSNKGQFIFPWGVAVDRTDNVYVCDFNNHRIQVFTRTGEFIRMFGRRGRAPGLLRWPRYLSVAASTGRVYVAETGNHRVSVFSSEGEFIFTFGSEGVDIGEMKNPIGIAINEHGFVILSDAANHRVQVFHADGRFISTFGSKGAKNGQFEYPQGLAIMQNGDVIIADSGNNQVQILSS